MSSIKSIYLARNLDELQAQADRLPLVQFNDLSICKKLLDLYDLAQKSLDGGERDEEKAYVYLWRFIQLCLKINKTKLYQKDAVYIDSLLNNKTKKAIQRLESLQTSLKSRYAVVTNVDDGGEQEVKIENLKLDEVVVSPLEDDIKQIIEKVYISSKELVKLIEKTKLSLLLIDCRPKLDYDCAHMDFSYVIKPGREIDYVNLNADLITPGLVVWKLEEKLKAEKNMQLIEVLNRRSKYDWLVLFDFKSKKNDLTADNKLVIVKKAFYEFDLSKEKCKNEQPLILDGGWSDWIGYYPAYKTVNAAAVAATKVVDDELNTSLGIEYPNLDEDAKEQAEQSDEDNESVSSLTAIKPIPNVDRTKKPSVVKTITTPFVSSTTQPQAQQTQQTVTIQPQQPVLQFPVFQRPNFNMNISQAYKPVTDNMYIFKPLKSSIMQNGITKYLNPITGTLDHVMDEGKKIQYTPNDVIPQLIVNRNLKPVQPVAPPVKPPTIPPKRVTTVAEPKRTLKRTYSSPNIEKLDDEEEVVVTSTRAQDESSESEEDNTVETPPVQKPSVAALAIVNAVVPKPIVAPVVPKRDNKPMPDHIKKIRMEELEPQYSNVQPGLTGIRNLGNTCFMNSIIQCLNNTRELKEYFLVGAYRNHLNRTNPLGFGGEIADEFSILVNALWWGHCKTIAPKRFKALIGQFNSQFVANDQQDAQEFLLFLLDGLHEDLNKVVERPRNLPEIDYDNLDDNEGAMKAWEHHKKLNNSIIVDLFQGMFRSIVACLECGKQSVKFDAFMYLTLPISQSRCSLYECLNLFLKPEKMTGESKWKCPNCKTYREAAKKIDIWSLPRLLIIHLKRFKYQGMWRDKIKTVVDYPIENLDLSRFILNPTAKQSLNYRLFAISNHTGTLDGGHYTAFCKHDKLNRWFKYDDSLVKETDLDSIKSAASSYILFYSSI